MLTDRMIRKVIRHPRSSMEKRVEGVKKRSSILIKNLLNTLTWPHRLRYLNLPDHSPLSMVEDPLLS